MKVPLSPPVYNKKPHHVTIKFDSNTNRFSLFASRLNLHDAHIRKVLKDGHHGDVEVLEAEEAGYQHGDKEAVDWQPLDGYTGLELRP